MTSRRAFVLSAVAALAVSGCRRNGRGFDLDGHPVDPLAGPARATVLVFTSIACPLSNRYAPEIRRVFDTFAPRGVAFWLVYPEVTATATAVRDHVRAYGYPFAALRDPDRALVRAGAATITPEVAVFIPGGKLVYHGRIDDRFVDFGKERPAPTRRDLDEALEAILAGRPVAVGVTAALGCAI